FDANIQILLIDLRQVRLQNQFVLGFVDVYRRRPGSERRIVAARLKAGLEKPVYLVLQGRNSRETIPTADCVHFSVPPDLIYCAHKLSASGAYNLRVYLSSIDFAQP